MSDTTVTKVKSQFSPRGAMGQKYLASGKGLAMRLWEDEGPTEAKPPRRRDYETVGFVIRGRAELHLEGQMVLLEPGDSWVVPRNALHTYKVLLGAVAVKRLLGVTSVNEVRGRIIEQDGRKYFVTYHPAVRFYREDLAKKITEDFALLKEELKEL